MLNLTALFQHYDMAKAEVLKPSRKRRNTTQMARSDAEYAAVMKGKSWMSTGAISAALGKSNRAGIGVLRRLLAEGKVERREVPRKQGHPYMEWRWV